MGDRHRTGGLFVDLLSGVYDQLASRRDLQAAQVIPSLQVFDFSAAFQGDNPQPIALSHGITHDIAIFFAAIFGEGERAHPAKNKPQEQRDNDWISVHGYTYK